MESLGGELGSPGPQLPRCSAQPVEARTVNSRELRALVPFTGLNLSHASVPQLAERGGEAEAASCCQVVFRAGGQKGGCTGSACSWLWALGWLVGTLCVSRVLA